MTKLNPQGMSTRTLLELYNEHALELGERQVSRFADRDTAERRTVEIHDRVVLARKPIVHVVPQVAPTPDPLRYNEEGKARLLAAAEALAAQPEKLPVTSPAKAARWARPKHEAPGAKAYRPKAGTSQAAIYALLVRPEGTDIEAFCAAMNEGLKPGVSPWTPSNTWSCLRYLFCAGKGYGLRFDGRKLWLLVPRVEVPAKGADAK